MGYFVLCFVGAMCSNLEKRGMSECYIIIIIILSALLHDIHADAVSFRPVPILNSAKFINIGQTAYERFTCHPIVYFTAIAAWLTPALFLSC